MNESKRGGIKAILTVVLLLGIFILVGWLLEQKPKQLDLTLVKEYTLSPETMRLLNQKIGEVEMLAFFQPDQEGRERAAYLLDSYAYASNKIRYRFVDPDREPLLAQKYDVKGYGQLVLTYGGRHEKVTFLTEQDITNALAKLMQNQSRTAYFIVGHGERALNENGPEGYSRLIHALEQQNYRIVPLNVMTVEKIPQDAALIIGAGPTKEFFPEELKRLEDYVEKGGSLLLMLDPVHPANLELFLKSKNILLGKDLIIDKRSRVLGGDSLMPVISKYADHAITKNSTTATIMYEVCSVRGQKGQNWIAKELAFTSAESWAETDLKTARENQVAVFNEGNDIPGPVSVAVISTKILDQIKIPGGGLGADSQSLRMAAAQGKAFEFGHVMVIGDSDFAKNALFDLGGNSDLALNAVNFLAKSPQLISIRPKLRETNPLTLTYTQAQWLFWYAFAIMPGLIILGGLGAWIWKRGHR